jgi:hypothetical protein
MLSISFISSKSSIRWGGLGGMKGVEGADAAGCMGAKVGFVGLGVGVMGFDRGTFGVALDVFPGAGAGVGVGVGVDLAAGVDGGLTTGSGFGFILVIKNDSFAPVPLGSHSIKLYEGK